MKKLIRRLRTFYDQKISIITEIWLIEKIRPPEKCDQLWLCNQYFIKIFHIALQGRPLTSFQ